MVSARVVACSVAWALASGCAGAPRDVHAPTAIMVSAGEGDEGSLAEVVRAAGQGATSRALLDAWQVPRRDAEGAREITGDRAEDDVVDAARVVVRVGASAAVMVTTRCGNAALVGLAWRERRWVHRATHAVVGDARPGRCRVSRVTADARPMLTSEAREVIVTSRSRSDDGDDAPDPVLQLVHLGDDGALAVWARDVPFGREDDATGAITDAEWIVEEALMLPRDLYVELRPGRPGPGGRAPRELVRRTYRVVDGRLTLVDESLAPWRDAPDAGAASRGP